jgi:putative membrane protein
MVDNVAILHGAAFDYAYMAGQLADHEAAVSLFAMGAKEGKEAELKAFAAKTLSARQQHLQLGA